MAKNRKIAGVTVTATGFRTAVRVNGKLHNKSWPATTPAIDLETWILDTRKKFGGVKDDAGTFAADIQAYKPKLAGVSAKWADRQIWELEKWADVFGRDRSRFSITSDEISGILGGWVRAGVATETIRKRREALSRFFNHMDRNRVSPLKDAIHVARPKTEARGLPMATVAAVLGAMSDTTSTGAPSGSKIRAAVIAYTGIPPSMLARLQRHELNLEAATVRLAARRKAKGVEARTIPLTPQGVAAFKAFDDANLYGPFCVKGLNQCFKKGALKAGLAKGSVRLYDLRHSFLTELYRVTLDTATVARFAMHAEGSALTLRYTRAAHMSADRRAAMRFGASVGPVVTNATATDVQAGIVAPAVQADAPAAVEAVA